MCFPPSVFLDAPGLGECQKAVFLFGDDSFTRKYDIQVSQHACGSESGGPPGCLQYHMASSGKVASFNFPTTSTSVSASGNYMSANFGSILHQTSSILATHLSNQLYEICIRRASGNCAICYWPALTGSFGLS